MMGTGRYILSFWCVLLAVCAFAQEEQILLNSDFDNADLAGWRVAGDVCVAPVFCAGQPPGRYWLALSTNDENDSITLCGASSVSGMQTIVRTPDLPLPFKPSRIRIDFQIKFLTNENTVSDLGTDSLVVRLLTGTGPVVIAGFDDSGASPDSKNLTITGDATFHESTCNPTWKYETGMLQVSYYRTFREPVNSRMAKSPVALEFSLSNQFDHDFDSAVVLDDIQIRAYR